MSFTGKPKNHYSSLGKVLHKLFKQDRSIFYKTSLGETVINNKFIDKVVSKFESNIYLAFLLRKEEGLIYYNYLLKSHPIIYI